MNIIDINYGMEIFPSCSTWGAIYGKYRAKLVSSLNSAYCLADREDAVEYAFNKLMNKKDPAAYFGKMSNSVDGWVKALYWQARSYLSHMRAHSQVHAKFVEKMADELKNAFAPISQGVLLDAGVYSYALTSALDAFRREQDVSRRNLEIYLGVVTNKASVKDLAKKFKITENNVYAIKFRVGKLLAKYGKHYFQAALKKAA